MEENFRWKSLNEFGNEYLDCLRAGETDFADVFLNKNLLSKRFSKPSDKAVMRNYEDEFNKIGCSERDRMIIRWKTAYALSGRTSFVLDGTTCESIDDVIRLLRDTQLRSLNDFEKLCKKLISRNGELFPEFEVWLELQHKFFSS